ncbi:MAG: anti-sigma F factor [Clostridia bacterium]|nr:anti-sigma F factor [Clostridia bacterium]
MNTAKIEFSSCSENEAFARVAAAAFVAPLDPTVEELSDIKTAVSEAVTNAVIHGYEDSVGKVFMELSISGRLLTIEITDYGRGIADIKKAMTPMYTSKPRLERSGMGFTVMESFMDSLSVKSAVGKGTSVLMTKRIL